MPYTVEWCGSILVFNFHGTVDSADLHNLLAEAPKFESGEVVPHRLTDVTAATELRFKSSDVAQFAAVRKATTFRNSFKSAIVYARNVHLGYVSLFQTLNNHHQITIELFRDRDTARKWLEGGMRTPDTQAIAGEQSAEG